MSLAINIYKKQRNILLVLVKKIDNMKLWSLLALNGRSLSSKEAEKVASSSHKQAAVSLTPNLVWVLQWKKGHQWFI